MDAAGTPGTIATFEQIVQLVQDDHYHYSSHAEERMAERNITDAYVKETILTGEVLEIYTEDVRGWSYLVLAFPGRGPLHVQVGYNRYRELAIIITVYIPEPPKWITPRQRGE